MTDRSRLIPIIVACPLLLQNLDTSIMATALPSIARSLGVEALHLNLAITSYLLSLAVFLPASGWLADRFGTRRVFCTAIVLFSAGSALCGLATSLPQLVLFRIVQGMGGAMMVPVGRLILLRSVPPAQMVAAMVWFTVPRAVGRVVGPLLGGFVVTWRRGAGSFCSTCRSASSACCARSPSSKTPTSRTTSASICAVSCCCPPGSWGWSADSIRPGAGWSRKR